MNKPIDLRNTFIFFKDDKHSKEFQKLMYSKGVEWRSLGLMEVPQNCIVAIKIGYDMKMMNFYLRDDEILDDRDREILFENGVITFADEQIKEGAMARFSNARVGDRVECFIAGKGRIVSVDKERAYPIRVDFDEGGSNCFTLTGALYSSRDVRPSLFYEGVVFTVTGGDTPPARVKYINGHKVPDISFTPSDGERYFYPDISPHLVAVATFSAGWCEDVWRHEKDVCYPFTAEGKQAAIAHAKALLDHTGVTDAS